MRRSGSLAVESSGAGACPGSNVISGRVGFTMLVLVGAAYSATPNFVMPVLKSSSFQPRSGSEYSFD